MCDLWQILNKRTTIVILNSRPSNHRVPVPDYNQCDQMLESKVASFSKNARKVASTVFIQKVTVLQ